MNSKLYEIADAYIALETMLDDVGDDENLEEAIGEALGDIVDNLSDKVDNICNLMASWDGHAAACSAEIKRLQARKQVFENRKAGLKRYLKFNLERLNKPRIETDTHTVSLRQGSLSVVVDDMSALPPEYTTTVVSPVKAAIKSALKDGPVAGAHIHRGESYVVVK